MNFISNPRTARRLLACVLPMAAFLGALLIVAFLKWIGGPFWLASPEYWIFPVQTLVCGAMLLWFRRDYEFHRLANIIFVVALATLVFALWISPQAFLGFPPRRGGFNPDLFRAQPALYWATVLLRFLRLVIVVPFMEEIFWRGFLLRYFINEDFDRVPFGSFSWFSFTIVTLGFTFAHSRADWLAAAATGALFNLIAYRTRSLTACILAHAITNLLLGFWIMQTKQWGFW